jgi:hypothetical protein
MTNHPMPGPPLAEKVLVSIVSANAQVNPSAWHLEYDVRNSGQAAVWLVVEESLVLRCDDAHIELSYARGQLQPDVQVFGYFDPQVFKIPPGGSRRQSVEITWPCRLSDIWNAERETTPAPGEYEVSVRVGFASTAAPEPPKVGESIEAPVLRWQEEAVSPPVRIAIPPYTRRRGTAPQGSDR